MKPLLFFLVVLQLTRIRGQTDGLTGTDEDDIDYKKEYEEVDKLFKNEREKLNIADQRLLEATNKITALETELKRLNDSCTLKAQTDDEEQLQEAYEEARKKNDELTQSLNLAVVKVLVLNKQLEANKQQSSIEQNNLTAAELKIAQLTRQLAEANERPQCNQNETNQQNKYSDLQNCPINIGTNSTCKKIRDMGCYCIVEVLSYWIGGSRHCRSEGMELVSIESEAEYSQIDTFLREQRSNYEWNFWTSALYNEEKNQWVWTANGQSVNYTNWEAGQPLFKEGEGHAIILGEESHKMHVEETSLKGEYWAAYYICEKNTNSVNRLRDSEMKQKSCSAGSDWTCHNEVTGCYCHQTIKRNWTDASALCESIGMNLVSIESAQEQLLVASGLTKLEGTGFWWTSGSDASGVWTWTATGRDLNYTNWAVDEPNKLDNSKHGVAVIGYSDQAKWVVYPVTREHFPICGK